MQNSNDISTASSDIGGLGYQSLNRVYVSKRLEGILQTMKRRQKTIRYLVALNREINRLGPCTKPCKVKLLVKLSRYSDMVAGNGATRPPAAVEGESMVDVELYTTKKGYVVSPPIDVVLSHNNHKIDPWRQCSRSKTSST